MAINTTFTTGAVLTAAQMNNLPWGVAGKAKTTTNTTLSGTSQFLTNTLVTWTANPARLYKLTAFVSFQITAGTGSVFAGIFSPASARISEGGQFGQAGTYASICCVAYESGLSGSVSRQIKAQYIAGGISAANTLTDATYPTILIVEDIGPA
tara:strand:- start:85 stop:543 length:459 start_codon:yes stop_codon:yes gene_type:complete